MNFAKTFQACMLLALSTMSQLKAQTHLPKTATINKNIGGYYEYLPANYESATEKFPVIIFLHGSGEGGDGSTNDLHKLLKGGLPALIERGGFPASFTSKGKQFSFVVISPQFKNWPGPGDVNDIVDYVTAHYNIDLSRIYLTGCSMGGGAIWEYVGQTTSFGNKIAAIVPVCGASTFSDNKIKNIVDAKVAVWATHNKGDGSVASSGTVDYINHINAIRPSVIAKMTIFNSNNHDAWTKTYNPSFKEDGLNIYEWMLKYKRETPKE